MPRPIEAFLLAQITEDEIAAQAAVDSDAWGNPYSDEAEITFTERYSPTRALADCAARRQILELHSPGRLGRRCLGCEDNSQGEYETPYPCPTVLALAQSYAGHPGFLDEWRLENA